MLVVSGGVRGWNYGGTGARESWSHVRHCLLRTCVFQISEKWYISAFISETGSPVAQVSPILFTVLSSGDVHTSAVYR